MLKIDNIRVLEGVNVYGDDTDPTLFYVVSERPRFRTGDDGEPVFTFVKYRTPRPRKDGTVGGGFVFFDVEFAESATTMTRIMDALTTEVRQRVGPGKEPQLGRVQWAKGTASLNFQTAAGGFVKAVTNPGSPSLFGRNITPFTIELDQEGSTLFAEIMQGKGGAVQVAYETSAWVRLPPTTGFAKFDSHKYYDFVQEITEGDEQFGGGTPPAGPAEDDPAAWGADTHPGAHPGAHPGDVHAGGHDVCGPDTRIEVIREWARSREIMDVQVTPGPGVEQRVVDRLRESLLNALEQTTARKMAEQLGQYDGDRSVLEDYDTVRREYHKVKIDSFKYTITENSTTLWPFDPRGTLPNIDTMTNEVTGQPVRWGDHFREVDLDDPFFRTLEVAVQVNMEFAELPVHSVDVHIEFEGERLYVEDLHFTDSGETKRFSCFTDGKDPEYRYSYIVNFTGSAQVFRSPVKTSRAEQLTIGVDDTGLLIVDVDPGDLDFQATPSAVVTVRYEPAAAPVIEEQFVFTKEAAEPRALQQVMLEPRTRPVTYKIDYRTDEGKHLVTPWRETVRRLSVNSPFRDQRTLHVFAVGDLEDEIDSIWVDLNYTDPANDYTVTESVSLDKQKDFYEWDVPVISAGAGTISYSGRIRRRNGTVETVPTTVAETASVSVGEVVEDFRQVVVQTFRVAFTRVAAIRVVLRYGDQREELLLRDATTKPDSWRIEVPDKDAPFVYRWSATYYLTDGTTVEVPESTSDVENLVLPNVPA